MRGILSLVESKRPAVFGDKPIIVDFTVLPRVGEPFLFTNNRHGFCNTSEVKAIDSETGEYLITTRNSIYKLAVE